MQKQTFLLFINQDMINFHLQTADQEMPTQFDEAFLVEADKNTIVTLKTIAYNRLGGHHFPLELQVDSIENEANHIMIQDLKLTLGGNWRRMPCNGNAARALLEWMFESFPQDEDVLAV